eukprot:6396158-Lingulodinium_polyedra.AAC.1
MLQDAKQRHQLRRKKPPAVTEKTPWQRKAKGTSTLVVNREKGRVLAAFANNGERPSGTRVRDKLQA